VRSNGNGNGDKAVVSNDSASVASASGSARASGGSEDSGPPPAPRIPHSTKYNVIEKSQWSNGVPATMGGHLMPSGEVCPVTKSEGVLQGRDAAHEQHLHPFTYHEHGMGDDRATVQVSSSKQDLATSLVAMVRDAARTSIADRGAFTLALSGGSLLNLLAGLAEGGSDASSQVDWTKAHVFWVDERHVPLESEDSNAGAAKAAFLDALPIPTEQVHVLDASLSVAQAARQYEGQMLSLPAGILPRTATGFPILDCVLLGVGPDGHVASLFPNRPELASDATEWILPIDNSPKPPPQRITMTLPVLNAGRHVAVVASGAGKAEIVQRVLEVQTLPGALPAQLVRPTEGTLTWFLDRDSAADLRPNTWTNHKAHPRSDVPKPAKPAPKKPAQK